VQDVDHSPATGEDHPRERDRIMRKPELAGEVVTTPDRHDSQNPTGRNHGTCDTSHMPIATDSKDGPAAAASMVGKLASVPRILATYDFQDALRQLPP
jgi:hypothetical protein